LISLLDRDANRIFSKIFGWQAARRGAIFLVLMFGVPLALYAAVRLTILAPTSP
jgi:hypothetical protein